MELTRRALERKSMVNSLDLLLDIQIKEIDLQIEAEHKNGKNEVVHLIPDYSGVYDDNATDANLFVQAKLCQRYGTRGKGFDVKLTKCKTGDTVMTIGWNNSLNSYDRAEYLDTIKMYSK